MLPYLKALLLLAITGTLTWVLNTSHGTIPPLGKLLSPYQGFWRNGETAADFPEQQTLQLPGLQQPVQVRFDDRRVPHIFAQNDHDLYYAQGYLTARDRLWQMEFQTHVAAGRLSEIVGDSRLITDRFFRRMGLKHGAEQSLRVMMADPTVRTVLTSYSDGVNAYIQQLTPRTLPFEYKLLNYAPEPWQPLKSALLLKLMAFDLSGRSDDLRLSNIRARYGADVVQDLFPDYPRREDPIVPVGAPRDFTPVPIPAAPKAPAGFAAEVSGLVPQHEPDAELGSNNFAVSGAKSATGFPLLANDPHLQLNLPSIWYQVQLIAPGVNVYGVTIPGAPAVIIGFNQQVAWGVTNVGADVLDWYQLKFQDARRRAYWHDGRWKPVRRQVEVFHVRGQPDQVDTVLYTHHGPVVYDEDVAAQGDKRLLLEQTPIRHALRWTAHEGANEVLTFYRLNRARNYQDYTTALSTYASPAQNFIFASAGQDIAIWPNGRFPLKWRNQGKFVLDGTDPAHDWHGWIPPAHNPHVKNPARGFVSSANQFSAGPEYPYYIGWEFEPWDRGHRINEQLTRMSQATVDSLRLLQLDEVSITAHLLLPRLLTLVSRRELTAAQRPSYDELQRWNYRYAAHAIAPSVFELWYARLVKRLWDDDFPSTPQQPMRYPSRDRTITLLLEEPTSRWIDDRTTPAQENLAQLARESLQWATDSLARKSGPVGPAWQWSAQKSTDILHLAQLPGFGRMDLDCGGGAGIVNATSQRNGPSWRMVVALGPQPKAYGIFPGGESGHPGSRFYDDMVDTWRTGQLDELVYLHRPNEAHPRLHAAWTLQKP